MRLALVAPFGLRVKGTASARVMPLARALAALGYEVSVWIPPYDTPEDGGSCWEEAGVSVVNLPCADRLSPRSVARLGWEIAQAVRAWSPDLIHVFKPKGPSGLAALLLQRLPAGGWRPPLILDTDDWEGARGWNDDPRLGYSGLQKRVFSWQERYGLTHASAWTAASDCLRQRAVRFGAPAGRVWVVPNGVAIDDWPFQPWSERRRYVILYTRFAGVRVEAVKEMWERVLHLAPASKLMIVGQGLDRKSVV